jgi:hypothetical protein
MVVGWLASLIDAGCPCPSVTFDCSIVFITKAFLLGVEVFFIRLFSSNNQVL